MTPGSPPPATRPQGTRHRRRTELGHLSTADQDAVSGVLAIVAKALAAYERRLVRLNAPFDTWVDGLQDGDPEKLAAMSESAVRGTRCLWAKRAASSATMVRSSPMKSTSTPDSAPAPGCSTKTPALGRLTELMYEDFSTFGPGPTTVCRMKRCSTR